MLAFGNMLSGHFPQVHSHTGSWTAAVHKVLKTFHTHFYWEETDIQSGNEFIRNVKGSYLSKMLN